VRTQQIPREMWPTFFKNLSQKQEGWEVSLEVLSSDIGDQIEERHMFLTGLTAELSNEASRPDKIVMMLGGTPAHHLTHTVTAPTEVTLQQTDLGIDSVLEIKSADGTTNLLHLK
jgi:hypothetical protein